MTTDVPLVESSNPITQLARWSAARCVAPRRRPASFIALTTALPDPEIAGSTAPGRATR